MSGVDWNRSVVAIALDGREATVFSVQPVNHGMAIVKISESDDQEWYAHANGLVRDGAWVIRNVAKHTDIGTAPANARTAPSGGEVGPEVVEALRDAVMQVQFLCCNHGGQCERDPAGVIVEIHSIADRALALLPEPVDADRKAAEILTSNWLDATPSQNCVELALAAIKRGRALAAGEVS